jgi:CRP/FNR family cyclic AMP-dependent transcriptional regulator
MKTFNERILEHPFSKGLSQEYAAELTVGAREVCFTQGEILFRENEPANRMFLVESGKIAVEAYISTDEVFFIQQLGPGDVLGWSWFYPPYRWHLRAHALEPSTAIELNGGHLLVAAERDKAFGYELMKRVARVLVNRLQAARKQLVDQAKGVELAVGRQLA